MSCAVCKIFTMICDLVRAQFFLLFFLLSFAVVIDGARKKKERERAGGWKGGKNKNAKTRGDVGSRVFVSAHLRSVVRPGNILHAYLNK